ncbi:MAG: hypothetical protein O2794_01820 [bacterium]|nr:hypothetical protein [bacterium]
MSAKNRGDGTFYHDDISLEEIPPEQEPITQDLEVMYDEARCEHIKLHFELWWEKLTPYQRREMRKRFALRLYRAEIVELSAK